MVFNGERLKQARILRGLTVAELAERISQQRQTLSMYELNKSQPSNAVVSDLAKTLKFPTEFFYERNIKRKGTVYFRSLLTTNKRYRSEQIAKMEILSQVYHLLQEYIVFPKFDLTEIPSGLSIEETTQYIRDLWNLGNKPIENIIPLVERHGILVTTFGTGTDDIDAFSETVFADDNFTFLIAYSNNRVSASRIHFDIAHELGHICLHEWSEDIEDLTKDEFKSREQEANDFAAAFLLPEEAFRLDVSCDPCNLVYYKKLKKKWKVSIAAMIRRARDLRVISPDDYQMLVRIMQRRGQRREEPLDDVMMTASPSMLKASVIMLLQEGVFTPKEFMTALSSNGLSIYPEDIEELLALPDNTLVPPKMIDLTEVLKLKSS